MKFLPLPLVILVCFLTVYACAQPGRDLEFKDDHPEYHFGELPVYAEDVPHPGLVHVFDSVPHEDRVYVTYDSIQGILLNGYQTSVFEFPSMLRYALLNPAKKPFLPKEPSKAVIILKMDPQGVDFEHRSFYRREIGKEFVEATILNVLYDIWNEDARITEDLKFEFLSEKDQIKVARQNPHKILYTWFSLEGGFSYSASDFKHPESEEYPYLKEGPLAVEVKPRNILSIFVDSSGKLFVQENEIDLEHLSEYVRAWIVNEKNLDHWPEIPARAVITLRHDWSTEYEIYWQVYKSVRDTIHAIRQDLAIQQYGRNFGYIRRTRKAEYPVSGSVYDQRIRSC